MSAYKEIVNAIADRLDDMSGGWAVAYPNVEYTPVAGTSYLQLDILPALTEQAELGTAGQNSNLGIAQITIHYSGANGWGKIYDKADQIAEWFKRGTKLVNGGITVTIESVQIGPMLNDEGWLNFPVSINYRAYTPN